mmetsp:Transcript_7666/g.8927  ORF Transcript_7666/g.8927 Transcript_7666/m.8927 type:complete len:460 (-) Transcript_7666:91-1470(-)
MSSSTVVDLTSHYYFVLLLLIKKMAVPAMVLIFLPLYFLKKHMIDRCNGDDTNGTKENNVINDGDKKSTIDGIENGNVRCDEMLNNSDTSLVRTYAAKTTSSFGTEPTVRQSRLDTDGTLDYSIPSADYFRNLDPCNSCVVEVGLGRRLKEDENYVFSHPSIRNDNDHPPNLQHVVEFDLPVGFYRLRKAMLGSESTFWTDVIMRDSLRYSRITQGQWDQHHHYIGLPTPTPHTNTLTESDFLNTTRKTSFLMPQTAILKPSMAHETATITQYSPNEFTITILTLTPDVPFGSKIVSHTQIAVANTGNLTCHMTCSCEVTFPTGAPSMGFGAQIKKQSKLASVNTFHKIAGAIRTCVEEDNDVYSNYSEGDANSFVYDLNKTSGAPRLVLKSPKLELTDMPSIIFASADGRNDDVDDDDVLLDNVRTNEGEQPRTGDVEDAVDDNDNEDDMDEDIMDGL